jgi:hypothetical protein
LWHKKTTKIINVKKPPTVSIDPISDSCGTVTINPIANVENCTSNSSGLTYNWSFSGGNPVNSTSLNPGNIEYTNMGVYTVTLEVTSECGVSNTATQTFEVFEKPILTNTDVLQEICSNQATTEISLTSNHASTNYTWSTTASADVSGFIANGTSAIIPVQTLVNNSSTAGTVKFTVIPELESCEGDAVEFTVIVNPTPIISTQPISSEICLDGQATELVVEYQNGTGTASYQWFSNATNTSFGGNIITAADTNSYNPPTDTVGTTYYYAEISFSSGGCLKIVSNPAIVIVNEQITVNSVTAPQTICAGGTANEMEVTYSGGTGTASYQWFSNITNLNTGGTIIAGATASKFTPSTFITAGVFYYYAEISLDGIGCTSATSAPFEINVLEDPIIDL